MAGKVVYKNDICPECKTPWDGKIATGFYDGEQHELEKAVCQKCGKVY